MQLRAIALPPKAYEIQLGRTLDILLEFFFVVPPGDNKMVLEAMGKYAESLNLAIDNYADALAKPATP